MSYWFSFLFPWLMAFWLFHSLASRLGVAGDGRVRWGVFVGVGLLSAVVVLLPVRGIPAGRWLAGLNFQPSLPLLGLAAGLVWKAAFQKTLMRPSDGKVIWIFGAVMGTALYPLALGLGDFDPYSWGWSFSALFPMVALITIWLILRANRFGWLLLLSIVAYDLRLLESPNFWDYLVDPIYWLVSLGALTRAVLKKLRPRKPCDSMEKACASDQTR